MLLQILWRQPVEAFHSGSIMMRSTKATPLDLADAFLVKNYGVLANPYIECTLLNVLTTIRC
jgi:hypothetical protein